MNRSSGSGKYFGLAIMPMVQVSASTVNTRCSASANHENQPVRK